MRQNDRFFKLNYVLHHLLVPYLERVPSAKQVMAHLAARGETVLNDHIAFRSLLGIKAFEKIFLSLGYERMGPKMIFQAKHLNAFWYKPPTPRHPRIFISELCYEHLSERAQSIIFNSLSPIIDQLELDSVTYVKSESLYDAFGDYFFSSTGDGRDLDNLSSHAIARFLNSSLWTKPTFTDFQALQAESEWASWAIFNEYYLNHFTVAVHRLRTFNHLSDFNDWLETELQLTLNTAGGKIKRSADGRLLQSATVANMIDGQFANGEIHQISGSYAEYAYRDLLPEYDRLFKSFAPGNRPHPFQIPDLFRRDGFETSNADKIFESTYSDQVKPKT